MDSPEVGPNESEEAGISKRSRLETGFEFEGTPFKSSAIDHIESKFHHTTDEKVPEPSCVSIVPFKLGKKNDVYSRLSHQYDYFFEDHVDLRLTRLFSLCYLSKRRNDNSNDHKQKQDFINSQFEERQDRLRKISQRFEQDSQGKRKKSPKDARE